MMSEQYVVPNHTLQKSVNSHGTGKTCHHLLGEAVRSVMALSMRIADLENNHDRHDYILNTISLHEPEEDMPPPTTREGVKVLQKRFLVLRLLQH